MLHREAAKMRLVDGEAVDRRGRNLGCDALSDSGRCAASSDRDRQESGSIPQHDEQHRRQHQR